MTSPRISAASPEASEYYVDLNALGSDYSDGDSVASAILYKKQRSPQPQQARPAMASPRVVAAPEASEYMVDLNALGSDYSADDSVASAILYTKQRSPQAQQTRPATASPRVAAAPEASEYMVDLNALGSDYSNDDSVASPIIYKKQRSPQAQQARPATASPRVAAAPEASEYSVDLNALGFDDSDGDSIAPAVLDRILSADIDGPTDFTENMGAWMGGTPMRRGGTPGRASSPTLSPARSPVMQRAEPTTAQNKDDERELFLEKQLKGLQAKYNQLNSLNSVVEQTLKDERKAHSEELKARQDRDFLLEKQLKGLQAKYNYLNTLFANTLQGEREAHTEELEAVQERDNFLEEQLKDLQGNCNQLNSLNSVVKQALDDERKAHAEEIKVTREELKARQERDFFLEKQLKGLQELQGKCKQLNSLNSVLKQALDDERKAHAEELKTARKELDDERKTHAEELKATRKEQLKEFQGKCKQINSLNSVLKQALDDERKAHAEELKTARKELDDERKTHAEELKATRKEQLKEFQGKCKQLNSLNSVVKQALDDEQKAHAEEIKVIREEHQAENESIRKELEAMRQELKVTRKEIKVTRKEKEDMKQELKASKKEHKALGMAYEAIYEKNKAMTIDLEERKKEREIMVKTLMHQWGKEECGASQPQKYRYMTKA